MGNNMKNKMRNIPQTLALAAGLLVPNVQAEIVFNGFASVVGGITTDSDERLYDDYLLHGYDDSFSFSKDSLFALQASSDLGEGLSVTAQILSRSEDSWNANFEWAYIAYDVNDNLRLLAGRQRTPFYMYSDYLDVSYAYPWITPPQWLYNISFDTFDGLGAIYNRNIGEFDTTLQLMYGRNNDDGNIAGEDDIKADYKDLFGISLTVVRDWLTLRAGYNQTDLNMPIEAFNDISAMWREAGYTNVANNVEISEDLGTFIEVGFQVDYENILIIGEYSELNLDGTLLSNQEAYYLMGGYRFDTVLAHLTYGVDDGGRGRITGSVPVDIDPALDGLIAITDYLADSQRNKATFITVGLRWDFHDSAALKFEYSSYKDDLNFYQDSGVFRTALVTVF